MAVNIKKSRFLLTIMVTQKLYRAFLFLFFNSFAVSQAPVLGVKLIFDDDQSC
jgi:hypothetical protein